MAYLQCDCDQATRCPQGHTASMPKCRIWKADPPESSIKVVGHRDEIVHQATCHGCGSILEYHRPDIKFGYTRECTPKQYRYIDCPICKEQHKDNSNIAEIGRVCIDVKDPRV